MKKVFNKRFSRKQVGWGALIILLVIQVFSIDKTNPPADPQKDFLTINNPPEGIASMLKNSCYDCHSYHSEYPWYTNIEPVSWWVKGHIKEGRKHLNFSEWGNYDEKRRTHKLEECVEVMAEQKMPLTSYIIAHSEARLSKDDTQRLQDYFAQLQ